MKIADSQARQLLATVLDGSDMGGGHRVEEQRCTLCRAFLVRFTVSAGLSQALGLPSEMVSCTNTKTGLGIPCIGALKAKPFLDALSRATKR